MKLLICDDHELYREGLKFLLTDYFSLKEDQAYEATDMEQVYKNISNNVFTVILLDLSMPGSKGIQEISPLRAKTSSSIIVISADNRSDTIQAAMELGAAGYISKNTSSEVMLLGIEEVIAGRTSFPVGFLSPSKKADGLLSKRQLSIIQCLIDGCSNRQIADKLKLSEGTVKQYVSTVLSILGVDNRTQAAIKGVEFLRGGNAKRRK